MSILYTVRKVFVDFAVRDLRFSQIEVEFSSQRAKHKRHQLNFLTVYHSTLWKNNCVPNELSELCTVLEILIILNWTYTPFILEILWLFNLNLFCKKLITDWRRKMSETFSQCAVVRTRLDALNKKGETYCSDMHFCVDTWEKCVG